MCTNQLKIPRVDHLRAVFRVLAMHTQWIRAAPHLKPPYQWFASEWTVCMWCHWVRSKIMMQFQRLYRDVPHRIPILLACTRQKLRPRSIHPRPRRHRLSTDLNFGVQQIPFRRFLVYVCWLVVCVVFLLSSHGHFGAGSGASICLSGAWLAYDCFPFAFGYGVW